MLSDNLLLLLRLIFVPCDTILKENFDLFVSIPLINEIEIINNKKQFDI